jgi:hypothetical protein
MLIEHIMAKRRAVLTIKVRVRLMGMQIGIYIERSRIPQKGILKQINTFSGLLLQIYFALPAFFAQAVPQYFALASKVVKVFLHT